MGIQFFLKFSASNMATLPDYNGKYLKTEAGNAVWAFEDVVNAYTNLAAFPVAGEAHKLYIDSATSFLYRWDATGLVYAPVVALAGYYTSAQIDATKAYGFFYPTYTTLITTNSSPYLTWVNEASMTNLNISADGTQHITFANAGQYVVNLSLAYDATVTTGSATAEIKIYFKVGTARDNNGVLKSTHYGVYTSVAVSLHHQINCLFYHKFNAGEILNIQYYNYSTAQHNLLGAGLSKLAIQKISD